MTACFIVFLSVTDSWSTPCIKMFTMMNVFNKPHWNVYNIHHTGQYVITKIRQVMSTKLRPVFNRWSFRILKKTLYRPIPYYLKDSRTFLQRNKLTTEWTCELVIYVYCEINQIYVRSRQFFHYFLFYFTLEQSYGKTQRISNLGKVHLLQFYLYI